MKKAILLSFAMFAMTAVGVAQNDTNTTESETVATENGAKIEFETETIDYGTIENNADGNREFTFTNTGNTPLVITNAKGSCGCTVPTWPKEAIAPGESAVIGVRYATNRTGSFSKSITLTSNAINAPKKVIRIKGTVKPKPTEEKDI
ncbi:DUF1573 domain-containing protein [Lacinutrix sp. C3R15]|uniref:DUF1573 domain-containing protein n=1 Tax=Flavobacteriaceae TaxID=49546 RepID=UPI001C097176|nr:MULTISPECIES: DUF1573 domain-containing protein [Flavobacteriaceae]MBU2940013.1 DUF1573 domain-containing protein [Lacinutrix sp. C3R15]MDO6623330.1 DUF1573 domain-containing protein [Oceanihabitans sp. 1_MG-2023]